MDDADTMSRRIERAVGIGPEFQMTHRTGMKHMLQILEPVVSLNPQTRAPLLVCGCSRSGRHCVS